MVLEKLDIYLEKKGHQPIRHILYKINSKWIIHIQINYKAMKLLEKKGIKCP